MNYANNLQLKFLARKTVRSTGELLLKNYMDTTQRTQDFKIRTKFPVWVNGQLSGHTILL